MKKKIHTALISVYHKDNLEPVVRELHKQNVKLIATGGTQQFIESLGIPVTSVESITEYPSILDGRVKTLHPKIFGSILRRDDEPSDKKQLEQYSISPVDLVMVDLYPFEEIASQPDWEGAIEMIDIGGVALIRAAAKNFNDVLVIPSRLHYEYLSAILKNENRQSTLEQRKLMAAHAFNVTSHYDTVIFHFFNLDNSISAFKQSILESKNLRYGENPHQQGIFFGRFNELFEQLSGKEISYNNLSDIDSAVSLIAEFTESTCGILKHNNACGIASRNNLTDAWKDSLVADTVSAFGGVIIANVEINKEAAEEMNNLFFEILIAPSFDKDALAILKQKKNRILLIQKRTALPSKQFRSTLNGIIEQDRDTKIATVADMKTVTKTVPTKEQFSDLVFANKIVKHTKSNSIVLVKNKMLLASGMGQTSRVDALQHAIVKANNYGFDLRGAVLASDAFFPFADCVEIACKAGIVAVIQPGGSVKDQESIDYCNTHGLAMILTGIRHFKH